MLTSIFLASIWILLSLYWQRCSIRAKTNAQYRQKGVFYIIKVRYVVLVVSVLQLLSPGQSWLLQNYNFNFFVTFLGASLAMLGVAFAIWARYHLGSNWNSRPSLKKKHELITTGPYKFVRHPIYGGITVGLLGSILAGIHLWILVLVYFLPLYICKIHAEEKLLTEQFTKKYAIYKKSSKYLIPYLI